MNTIEGDDEDKRTAKALMMTKRKRAPLGGHIP